MGGLTPGTCPDDSSGQPRRPAPNHNAQEAIQMAVNGQSNDALAKSITTRGEALMAMDLADKALELNERSMAEARARVRELEEEHLQITERKNAALQRLIELMEAAKAKA